MIPMAYRSSFYLIYAVRVLYMQLTYKEFI